MDNIIYNGVPWYDQNNDPVNAEAGCLIKVENRFYLFGEYKTDDINHFVGFSKYSSNDLTNWHFDGMALSPQKEGILSSNRIGERVKVLQTPDKHFVMLMHTDDLKYNDPYIGLATADSIDEPFTFVGALKFHGRPIKLWDIGSFVDNDGTAYLLTHEGNIFKLSRDYLSVEEQVAHNIAVGGESPAMFRSGDHYFIMFSNKTSWERNDNYYLTATSIHGPWVNKGLFCPQDSLTYNSQCSFIYQLQTDQGLVPMYMGDRWSFPKQKSSATQVWLPISVHNDEMQIPEYWNAWDWQKVAPVQVKDNPTKLAFQSNTPNVSWQTSFSGTRILLYGETNRHSGYARIKITASNGQVAQDTVVDFYSLVPSTGLRYVSPVLPRDHYQISVTVTGENGVWFDKAGDRFGSDDYQVSLNGYLIEQ